MSLCIYNFSKQGFTKTSILSENLVTPRKLHNSFTCSNSIPCNKIQITCIHCDLLHLRRGHTGQWEHYHMLHQLALLAITALVVADISCWVIWQTYMLENGQAIMILFPAASRRSRIIGVMLRWVYQCTALPVSISKYDSTVQLQKTLP